MNGLITADIGWGRGLVEALFTVSLHCQQGDGVSVGVHAGPSGIRCDLAGSVHSARVMDRQNHPLLPAACWVDGFQTDWSCIPLFLFYDVMAAVRAGVVLQQPRIHTFLVESVSAGNDTQFLPINVLLQADGTVRGGAATECIQCSTVTFSVSLTFGLKLPGLHFLQCLHCKPVHGILTTSLFQFDLDKKNEANKRHNHKEGQENSHVKVLRGLPWGAMLNPGPCHFLLVNYVH